MSAKKLHDYYHNTWSKRFCDDITQLKGEIRELVFRFSVLPKADMVRQIFATLQARYPQKNFHYQTVYQYINYQHQHQHKTDVPAPSAKLEVLQASSDEPTSHLFELPFDDFELMGMDQ